MSEYNQVEIGKRLKDVRVKYFKETGSLTAQEFADLLGENRYNLSNYERGLAGIPNRVLFSLTKFGFNINWLITGEGSPAIVKEKPPKPDITDTYEFHKIVDDAVRAAAGNIADAIKKRQEFYR